MQRILWIGGHFFSASLERCGWQTHSFNFNEAKAFSWDALVEQAGWEPDVLVVADKSRPPFVLGMENFPCLTVFYCVDSHIHSYYPYYAQGFDICMLSLRDHMPMFQNMRLPSERIWWMPPFSHMEDAPTPHLEKKWDCLFVGTTNAQTLPKRAQFLEQLAQCVPTLRMEAGNFREFFGLGKVLINHCEHEDLNFRTFEALGCGGCLVTPRVGHGLVELFEDGKHLVMYESNSAEDAAKHIHALLDAPRRIERIARQGLEHIDARHRAIHRAQTFTERIRACAADAPQMISQRKQQAADIRNKWLRMPYLLLAESMSLFDLRQAYVHAARGDFV